MNQDASDLRKDFIRLFNGLARHHHRYAVFADFAELAYCAIAKQTLPPGEAAEALEERYMAIVKKHDADDIREMPRLLGMTQLALAEGGCDFLGSIAQELELTNTEAGQFFTPYEVSRLAAEMTIGDDPVPERGFHTLHEPACGAGGMVIAAADVMAGRGIYIATQLYAEAWDIAPLCYHLAYIQLAARGVPAVVRRANTLTAEFFEAAATPAMGRFLRVNGKAFAAWRAEEPRPDIPVAALEPPASSPAHGRGQRKSPETNPDQGDLFGDWEP